MNGLGIFLNTIIVISKYIYKKNINTQENPKLLLKDVQRKKKKDDSWKLKAYIHFTIHLTISSPQPLPSCFSLPSSVVVLH